MSPTRPRGISFSKAFDIFVSPRAGDHFSLQEAGEIAAELNKAHPQLRFRLIKVGADPTILDDEDD